MTPPLPDPGTRPANVPAWVIAALSGDTRAGLTFPEMLVYCGTQHGLVEQFERLTNSELWASAAKHTTPKGTLDKFTAFVWDCVWTRLPPDPRPAK